MKLRAKLISAGAVFCATSAGAADLEITHWWISGGEAAAVSEFSKALAEITDLIWIDGAIAGGGSTARPVIIGRTLGGDPMAATQLYHGRQSEELIEAGLMTDLTEIAEASGWKEIVNLPSLVVSCTFEGRICCVPVNIHSAQWLSLNHDAFEAAGNDIPANWTGRSTDYG